MIEDRSRQHVEERDRVRAGVLEHNTVELMRVGERLDREGLHHDGIYLSFNGERHQLAELDYLVNSRAVMTSLAENYAGLP